MYSTLSENQAIDHYQNWQLCIGLPVPDSPSFLGLWPGTYCLCMCYEENGMVTDITNTWFNFWVYQPPTLPNFF